MKYEKVKEALKKISGTKMLVLGDVMLDEYIWGDVKRISPEAPVQVVEVNNENQRPGGAGNSAMNLVSLGCDVYLAGVVGDDKEGDILINLLKKSGINVKGLFIDKDRPTTQKTRVIAEGQQVVRIDKEKRSYISAEKEKKLINYIADIIAHVDGILISDYLKGCLTSFLLKEVIKKANDRSLPVVVDPKGKDFTRYENVWLITPNREETEIASGIQIEKDDSIVKAGEFLLKTTKAKAVLITLGSKGMALVEPKKDPIFIPTKAKEVYDVSGAGDTVAAVVSASLASGSSFYDAASLANMAAGVVVGKIGTASPKKDEIIEMAYNELKREKRKFLDNSELFLLIKDLKSQGKKIVFTDGCFDILHAGHIELLKAGKQSGDILIVGIEIDESIANKKGKGRPFINLDQRIAIVSAIDYVDYVISFEREKLIDIIKLIKPDFIIKGSDSKDDLPISDEELSFLGGKYKFVDIIGDLSISMIAEKIRGNEREE